MKNRALLYTVLSLLLAVTLWSCGPSYVGVRTGGYGYGPGYYGARPYYGYGYGYRPPVVIAPRPYYNRPNYSYRNYGPRYGGGGRRGWR